MRLSLLCALLPVLAGCVETPAPASSAPPAIYASLASDAARLDVVAARDLINAHRRNLGLAPLTLDPVLMREAERQAAAMSAGGDVAKGARSDIRVRLKGHGLDVRIARESVSAGYFTVSDAFSGWRGSPTHEATLRLQPAKRLGVAASHRAGTRHHIYWALIVTE